MRLQAHEIEGFKSNIAGRLRLKLFHEITGKKYHVPLARESIAFIEKYKSKYELAALFTHLLINGEHYQLNTPIVDEVIDIDKLTLILNTYPLTKPALYVVKTDDNLIRCLWVSCAELEGNIGHFYTVIIFSERNFLNQLDLYAEFRVSQLEPEPALVILTESEPILIPKSALLSHDHPDISLSLQLLGHIATNPTGGLIPLGKLQYLNDVTATPDFKPPFDPILHSLLIETLTGKIKCASVNIPMELIRPFSHEHCFSIPPKVIEKAERDLHIDLQYGILLYWSKDRFVMSDDYITYLAAKKLNHKFIKAVIIGDLPEDIVPIKTGGAELLPPIKLEPTASYDDLSDASKDEALDEYIEEISLPNRLKNILSSICVVLTEDTNTELIENLLIANGFNIDQTTICSYQNCTNIGFLTPIITSYKSINPKITVIVHRDRDYLPQSEIEKIVTRIKDQGGIPFITKGTDLEWYYLNVQHACVLYKDLDVNEVQKIQNSVLLQLRDTSIENIKKYEHGDRHRNKASHLDLFIEKLYNQNKLRYTHGKSALGLFKSELQKVLGRNVQLIEASKYLKDDALRNISKRLWG